MSHDIGSIMYAEHGAINTVVSRLYPENINIQVAAQMLLLTAETCRVQFEEKAAKAHRLVPGTVYEHYRPYSPDRVEGHHEHILDEMDGRDAVYVTIRASGFVLPDFKGAEEFDELDLIGLAKVVPPFPGMRRRDAVIEEIAVHPLVQGQGLGRALVHAALGPMGQFDASGRVSTITCWGDDGSRHFAEHVLGLEERPEMHIKPLVLTDGADDVIGKPLTRIRFETPPRTGTQDVVRELERQKPWLGKAVPWRRSTN